jgi:hypothetical protein
MNSISVPKFAKGDIVWVLGESPYYTCEPCPACDTEGQVLLKDNELYNCPNCNTPDEDGDYSENPGWFYKETGGTHWTACIFEIMQVFPSRRLSEGDRSWPTRYRIGMTDQHTVPESEIFETQEEALQEVLDREGGGIIYESVN